MDDPPGTIEYSRIKTADPGPFVAREESVSATAVEVASPCQWNA